MSAIRATAIDVQYKRNKREFQVLRNFGIDIPKGSLVLILGANGAGKSTLLRVLAGMQEPQNGSVFWNEHELRGIPIPERPMISSCLFSNYSRVEGMNVSELVSLGRMPYTNWLGSLSDDDTQLIDKAISDAGITNLKSAQLDSLSDGEFRKALLAKMLAQDSELLFLDEPTAHLDIRASIDILRLISDCTREKHKTVVFSSHNLQLALKLADMVIILDADGNHAVGSPAEIVKHQIMRGFLDSDSIEFVDGNIRFIDR